MAFVLTQSRGGPVEVCFALAAELQRTGAARVRVFGPRPDRRPDPAVGEMFEEAEVASKLAVSAGSALLARIRRWAPDVVHAQDRRAGLLLARARVTRGRRDRPMLLQTYHGVPEDVGEAWFRGRPGVPRPSRYTRVTLLGDALVARMLDATVVPAESMRRFLQDRLRVPSPLLEHIDNGLKLPPPGPVPTGRVRHLMTVGLLVPRKGIGDLLDALGRPGVFPADASLTIVGDGPERAALEARASRPDLIGRVRVLGFRTDASDLLRTADALVVPSRMEQQPLIVIEAMAAGRPVLATDTGDAVTMLSAPGAARFTPPAGDVEALADALRALFSDPDPGRTGRLLAGRAAERYSVEVSARKHVELYRHLVERPAPLVHT